MAWREQRLGSLGSLRIREKPRDKSGIVAPGQAHFQIARPACSLFDSLVIKAVHQDSRDSFIQLHPASSSYILVVPASIDAIEACNVETGTQVTQRRCSLLACAVVIFNYFSWANFLFRFALISPNGLFDHVDV